MPIQCPPCGRQLHAVHQPSRRCNESVPRSAFAAAQTGTAVGRAHKCMFWQCPGSSSSWSRIITPRARCRRGAGGHFGPIPPSPSHKPSPLATSASGITSAQVQSLVARGVLREAERMPPQAMSPCWYDQITGLRRTIRIIRDARASGAGTSDAFCSFVLLGLFGTPRFLLSPPQSCGSERCVERVSRISFI